MTVRSVVEAEMAEISENLLVEEAKIPLVALMMEEVAAVIEPKFWEKVKSLAAPPRA